MKVTLCRKEAVECHNHTNPRRMSGPGGMPGMSHMRHVIHAGTSNCSA